MVVSSVNSSGRKDEGGIRTRIFFLSPPSSLPP